MVEQQGTAAGHSAVFDQMERETRAVAAPAGAGLSQACPSCRLPPAHSGATGKEPCVTCITQSRGQLLQPRAQWLQFTSAEISDAAVLRRHRCLPSTATSLLPRQQTARRACWCCSHRCSAMDRPVSSTSLMPLPFFFCSRGSQRRNVSSVPVTESARCVHSRCLWAAKPRAT